MAKTENESELLTSLATTTTTAGFCTKTTTPIIKQQTTRLVSLNSHTYSSTITTIDNTSTNALNSPHSINKQQRRPHNRKMKRKRKIPEISWLIVAICLNCYVIFSVTALATEKITNTNLTTISNTNINITTTIPYLKHTFSSANTNTLASHNQRHIRAASAHSQDDHHIDLDDVDHIMAHHINHHTDLVDADDMYLHNMDNIGYHHTGSLLPHELPEHDHIAHHL
ncbi:uncharacterized protein LOC119615630, partial [Lucilia sericata]|uniref:uncharacterized protein LOC119615630 n=1 Tax=Lucilia sericata TaxID=13632 RepID=UPI0018A863E1